MAHGHQGARKRVGWVVFAVLVVVKIVEYWIAVAMPTGNLLPMVLLAVLAGGLIMYYFMHMRQVWAPEE